MITKTHVQTLSLVFRAAALVLFVAYLVIR